MTPTLSGRSWSITPFFGTQLVLLSRQLSVVAESVNEVRFTLDSVFIGPAERQTLQIRFSPSDDPPPMFLEDLLTWIDSFAAEEGPRLIQDGGKFAVGESFGPIATELQQLVRLAEHPANAGQLPKQLHVPKPKQQGKGPLRPGEVRSGRKRGRSPRRSKPAAVNRFAARSEAPRQRRE